MLPADVAVWERFLKLYPHMFDSFDYDVHVGGDVERKEEWSDETFKMWSAISSKRIDVVGYKEGEVWIIEVKPEAGLTALGQLVGYKQLYIRDFKPVVKVECALVCFNMAPEERELLETQGFHYFVV
jgi:hypothetical protein